MLKKEKKAHNIELEIQISDIMYLLILAATDPWAKSDAELEYDPWEPRFPSTAWGRLNEVGWHCAESPS